jgi:hypothetical protein
MFAQPVPLPPAPPGVQVTHEAGFEFVTVDHPNNMPVPPEYNLHVPIPPQNYGQVDHAYRMSRTEVTNGQYLQFFQAWLPFAPADLNLFNTSIIGNGIGWTGGDERNPANWAVAANRINAPVEVSWYMAAYYCNWLQNGQISSAAAFSNGVYDASTFGSLTNTTPPFTGSVLPAPGAHFWIPTANELIMATHYDPNRFGPGQEGWWWFPYGSNDVPVGGYPGDPGAQTSAGVSFGVIPPPIASYPNAQTPWGLLDASGGAREWAVYPDVTGWYQMGSRWGSFSAISDDYVFNLSATGGPLGGDAGFRIAAYVPTPTGAGYVFLLLISRRKYR